MASSDNDNKVRDQRLKLKTFSKQMDEIKKSTYRQTKHVTEIQQSLGTSSLLGQFTGVQKSIANSGLLELATGVQKSIANSGLLELATEVQKSIANAGLLELTTEVQKSIANSDLFELITELQKSIDNSGLLEQFAAVQKSGLFDFDELSDAYPLDEGIQFKDFSESDIYVSEAGVVSIGAESATGDEIRIAWEGFQARLTKTDAEIESYYNNLPFVVKSVVKLIYDKLLNVKILFLLIVLSCFSNPESVPDPIKNLLLLGEIAIEQQVNVQTTQYVINVSISHVRESNSTESAVIDKLSMGQVVTALQKERHWRYVSYRDPDTGKVKIGWVAKKCLLEIE